MTFSIFLAFACAALFGVWNVLHAAASRHINSVLGAAIVAVASLVPAAIFSVRLLSSGPVQLSRAGIGFACLAGLCAFFIDYLALRAFSSGLEVSVGGPIIIGGGIMIVTLIGILLGDAVTPMKLLGVALVIVGVSLLASSASSPS
jgi:bacterial/archaeal transporter family protein